MSLIPFRHSETRTAHGNYVYLQDQDEFL